MGEVENWWKQSQVDFTSAQHCFESKDYYLSAFMCQQAVEKAIKALYIKEHQELLRIHDLVRLARDVHLPEELIKKCAVLNPVYVEVRYPESDEIPSDKIDSVKASNFLSLTKEILQWIEKKV